MNTNIHTTFRHSVTFSQRERRMIGQNLQPNEEANTLHGNEELTELAPSVASAEVLKSMRNRLYTLNHEKLKESIKRLERVEKQKETDAKELTSQKEKMETQEKALEEEKDKAKQKEAAIKYIHWGNTNDESTLYGKIQALTKRAKKPTNYAEQLRLFAGHAQSVMKTYAIQDDELEDHKPFEKKLQDAVLKRHDKFLEDFQKTKEKLTSAKKDDAVSYLRSMRETWSAYRKAHIQDIESIWKQSGASSALHTFLIDRGAAYLDEADTMYNDAVKVAQEKFGIRFEGAKSEAKPDDKKPEAKQEDVTEVPAEDIAKLPPLPEGIVKPADQFFSMASGILRVLAAIGLIPPHVQQQLNTMNGQEIGDLRKVLGKRKEQLDSYSKLAQDKTKNAATRKEARQNVTGLRQEIARLETQIKTLEDFAAKQPEGGGFLSGIANLQRQGAGLGVFPRIQDSGIGFVGNAPVLAHGARNFANPGFRYYTGRQPYGSRTVTRGYFGKTSGARRGPAI